MHFKTPVFCSILVVFEHKNMSSSPVPIEMCLIAGQVNPKPAL